MNGWMNIECDSHVLWRLRVSFIHGIYWLFYWRWGRGVLISIFSSSIVCEWNGIREWRWDYKGNWVVLRLFFLLEIQKNWDCWKVRFFSLCDYHYLYDLVISCTSASFFFYLGKMVIEESRRRLGTIENSFRSRVIKERLKR